MKIRNFKSNEETRLFNNRVENNILNWKTIFNQIMIYFDNRIIDTDTVQ